MEQSLIKKNNIEKLESVINRFIIDKNWGEQLLTIKIPEVWEEIVGETISKVTKVLNYDDKIVYVLVDSSIWMVELRLRKNELIDSINKKLEGNFVKDIVFKI